MAQHQPRICKTSNEICFDSSLDLNVWPLLVYLVQKFNEFFEYLPNGETSFMAEVGKLTHLIRSHIGHAHEFEFKFEF